MLELGMRGDEELEVQRPERTTPLAERRDHPRAAAVVADVHLPDGDAVQVELEHTEGPALTIQLPYSKKRFGIDYGQLCAAAGTRQLWLG